MKKTYAVAITLMLACSTLQAQDVLQYFSPTQSLEWKIPQSVSTPDGMQTALGYAVRFTPVKNGQLDTISLFVKKVALGSLTSSLSYHGVEAMFAWPIPFSHIPQTFLRHAVRCTPTQDGTLSEAVVYIAKIETKDAAINDSLRVSVHADSLLLPGATLGYVVVPLKEIVQNSYTTVDLSALNIAVKANRDVHIGLGLIGVGAEDVINLISAGVTVPSVKRTSAFVKEANRWMLMDSTQFGSDFEMRIRATIARPAAVFDDSLKVTVCANGADNLPGAPLAAPIAIPFASVAGGKFLSLPMIKNKISVSAGTDFHVVVEAAIVAGADSITFVSDNGTTATRNSLLYTKGGWGTMKARWGKDFNLWMSARVASTTAVTSGSRPPAEYSLARNYPNPFNPATTIRFSTASSHPVRLTVHDVLGREVAVLIDAVLPQGSHTALWNAEAHTSGVYFYRLSAGSFGQTRSMILQK